MVRKIKTSEVKIDNVSYDAVVETVSKVDEPTVEEPAKQETVPDVGQRLETEKLVGNVADLLPTDVGRQFEKEELVPKVGYQVEEKPKKEAEKGTCEICGKTMTLKNLKYAHSKVCSVNIDEVKEDIPKPALVRAVSALPPEENKSPKKATKAKTVKVTNLETIVEVPAVQRKPRQTRPKKVPESVIVPPSEPVVMKKSRAVLKAEKYTALAAEALP